MIDRSVIDQLEATPIEGVAERLGLQVIAHKCLCPFHDDTRPSLTFHIGRNRFRCFVCDAHGGVIDLVRGVKGLGFREACNWLDPNNLQSAFQNLPSFSRPKSGSSSASRMSYPPDLDWLSKLIQYKVLSDPARLFLYDERHIDPRVVAW